MLHLVFTLSPEVLVRFKPSSTVIFFNNAVLGLLKNSKWHTEIAKITPCYVLHDDLTMRGIESHLLIEGIIPIDYDQFVTLTVKHTPIQTWT